MTKMISISDEVYEELVTLKHEDESFTRLFKRFIEQKKKKPLIEFLGKWPGDNKEINKMKTGIEKRRKNFRKTSFGLFKMRPPGIEPGSEPWQGPILPFNYGRKLEGGVFKWFLKVAQCFPR